MGPGNRQFKGLKSIVTKGILTVGLLNILFLASAQDPADQVDLGCLYALPELDLKMHMYEPAFGMITQLNWMTGKAVPAAVGPNTKLLSPDDDGSHYSLRNQAGIKLLIAKLRSADEPVFISIVGSSRTVAAAFIQHPCSGYGC